MGRTPTPPEADQYDPGDSQAGPSLWHLGTKRTSFIALGVVVGLFLGGVYYARQRPVYEAGAQVLVVKKRADALPIQGMETQQAFYDDYVPVHLVLIKSPLIVGRAVKKAELTKLKTFEGGADPAGVVSGGLSVARDNKDTYSYGSSSNILNLSFRGPVAEDCPVILEAVIDSYRTFLEETYRHQSNDTVKLIETAKGLLQDDLKGAKDKYKDFRKNSPILPRGKDGGTVQQERLTNIEAKRSALLVRQAEIEARLKAIAAALKDGRDPTPLLELPTDAAKPSGEARASAAETQLLPLLLQEQQMMENFGPDYPELISVRKRIRLTRDLLAAGAAGEKEAGPGGSRAPAPRAVVDAHVRGLREQLEDAKLAEAALAHLFDEEHKQIKTLSNVELQEEDLRKDVAMTQQLYDSVIKRLQEVDLVKDYGGFDAQIVAPPGGGGKIGPKPTPIFGTALLAGLFAGLGLAWLAEVSDKGFRTAEEIQRRLGLPVVGHIPMLAADDAAREPVAGAPLDPMLCTYYQSKSADAEAYRGVRTALYFSPHGGGHKVIQVTSPSMGDGKSTLAANLAVSIAQSGKSVLLIDADFRRPRQHQIFALSAASGLASVIDGEADLDDAIQPTGVANLSVLPCGPRPHNPAELLTSPRLKELLEALAARYEFVLVDTPPLLAVSDPSIVAPAVDGVLLVIRVSRNARPAAERAKEILAGLGAKVAGVIVNGLGGKGARGYGQYYYGYRYEYTAEDDATSGGAEPAGASRDGHAAAPRRQRHRHGLRAWIDRLWP